MAYDRFIKWNPQLPLPEQKRIGEILHQYVSEIGIVEWKEDRFYVSFKGKGTQPFTTKAKEVYNPYRDERWFEVWIGEEKISVITREQDPITNAIAEGFAALIARYFQGKRED
jgi:hypothetical protein